MPKRFKIEEDKETLSLTFTPYGLALPFNRVLVVIIFTGFLALSVPVRYASGTLLLGLIILLVFLSKIPGLHKSLKEWRMGKSFRFDKTKNKFLIKGHEEYCLSDVSGIEINYEHTYDNESNRFYLDIRLKSGQRVRLMQTNTYRHYKIAGRQIAQFCQVELWDNHPDKKVLLWGKSQVNDHEVTIINERHSKYD